jgi:hypothetical protein
MGAGPWQGVAWHSWAIDSRAVCYAVGQSMRTARKPTRARMTTTPTMAGGDKQEAAGRDVMPGPGDCTASINPVTRRA